MAISIGSKVNILPEQGSGHRLLVGSVGEVIGGHDNDWEVRGERAIPATGYGLLVQYLHNDEISEVVEESLESFKALVVEKAQAAAKQHGWCNEVNVVLEALGLGDLITRKRTVHVTYAVVVDQAPGETDYTVQYRAMDGLTVNKRDDSAGKAVDTFWTESALVQP